MDKQKGGDPIVKSSARVKKFLSVVSGTTGPFSWWIPVSIAVFVTSIVAMVVSELATGKGSTLFLKILNLFIKSSFMPDVLTYGTSGPFSWWVPVAIVVFVISMFAMVVGFELSTRKGSTLLMKIWNLFIKSSFVTEKDLFE